MTCNHVAALFPGQGAHAPAMLDGVRHAPAFTERYALVCEALGADVDQALRAQQHTFLNRNEVSSLLTVLTSSLSYDLWQQQKAPPAYLAGYSVGEWTALYAAGVVAFPTLVAIVKQRADLMNRAVQEQPGGMIGVIGLAEKRLHEVVLQLRADGYVVEISNYNALGQYSLAVAANAMQPALQALHRLEPRKVVELPVAGAWHSSLLQSAATDFAAYLGTVSFQPPTLPIIDNVTGHLLPTELAALRSQLVQHLTSAVRWQQGVETLITLGCTRFVEIGYGNLLTKFGFFIDRSHKHEAFYA